MFEVKRGFFLKTRTFVYLCLEMRFFCGWLMGFLPYVATKCTANKKKKHPESLLIPGTDRHPFSQWNSGKKGHQNKFSRLLSTRALLVDFATSRSRAIEPVRRPAGNESQTEVKTKRQNHLRHANRLKKEKGMRIDSRKSQAGVI